MSDLKPLSHGVANITRQSFAKKFVALSRILEHWPDIIGKEFASIAQPQKLSYRKPKTKDDKPEATLHIMANPSDATSLHYQSDLILERINQIFGDRWVTKVKFEAVSSHVSPLSLDRPMSSIPPKPLSPAAQMRLNDVLEDISDPELRLRLEKLGQGVLRKQPQD
jgi:hypothetical protein